MIRPKVANKLSNVVNWYFNKRVAPFWALILLDTILLLSTSLVVYVSFVGVVETKQAFPQLIFTFLVLLIPYIIGFRIFHTYRAVVRYSSFVDLLQICYAMVFGGVIAIGIHYGLNECAGRFFAETRTVQILVSTAVSSVLMILIRVVVKTLYDLIYQSSEAEPAFVYGIQRWHRPRQEHTQRKAGPVQHQGLHLPRSFPGLCPSAWREGL